jgi:hypothetical protein
MLEILLLTSWMISGVVVSTVLSPRRRSKWEWAPVAAIFGLLWIPVAVDQRGKQATRGT